MKIRRFENQDIFNIQNVVLQLGEIHVWCIQWFSLLSWILKYWNIMCNQEQKEAQKFSNYNDQMRYAAAKILTRMLLSQYLELRNDEIHIVKTKLGKPYIQERKNIEKIQYNISHSGKFILLAFTRFAEIGIDIEYIRPLPEYLEIAHNFFSLEEERQIKNSKQQSIFYYYWTAKEAYAKAIGTGLFANFKTFSINGNNVIEHGKVKTGWEIVFLNMNENYVAHVAVKYQ